MQILQKSKNKIMTLFDRSCNKPVEFLVFRKLSRLKRLENPSSFINFDEGCGFCRRRVSNDSTSHLWMVNGYYFPTAHSISTNQTPIDAREKEIGTANRENVQRFLASLATYPMTEKLG